MSKHSDIKKIKEKYVFIVIHAENTFNKLILIHDYQTKALSKLGIEGKQRKEQ